MGLSAKLKMTMKTNRPFRHALILEIGLLLCTAALTAQSRGASALGTISALRAESAEFEIRLDSGGTATVQLSGDTVLQRVAPGEKDLTKAERIDAADLAAGDRVLVTFLPDSRVARRVIVMPAAAIAKRNEADKQDWIRRGLAGVVAEKKGNEITLRLRTMMGETQSKVVVTEKTSFRRYAAGSVKFSDAKPSTLAEVKPGDQLRARGQKSEDGQQVTAEEVVFGSFVTKAGEIVSVDAAQSLVTVKETGTGKTLLVKVQPDSQLKRMPSFPGGGPGGFPGAPGAVAGPPGAAAGAQGGGRGPGGPGPGGPGPGGAGGPSAAGPGAMAGGPAGGFGGGFPGGPGMGGGRPGGFPGGPGGPGRDLSQMFERFPAIRIGELKPGETIVVSSTLSSKPEELTAIMMVSNAEYLVRMAAMQQAQQGQAAGRGIRGGMGGAGMSGPGLGGGLLEFPTMIP